MVIANRTGRVASGRGLFVRRHHRVQTIDGATGRDANVVAKAVRDPNRKSNASRHFPTTLVRAKSSCAALWREARSAGNLVAAGLESLDDDHAVTAEGGKGAERLVCSAAGRARFKSLRAASIISGSSGILVDRASWTHSR